jgi:hypothetical protein
VHTSVPGDVSLHFTVGPAQTVQADVDNHRLVVIRDGKVIMDFPANHGLGTDPNRVTRSGTRVVMSKSPLYRMSNPAYGFPITVKSFTPTRRPPACRVR